MKIFILLMFLNGGGSDIDHQPQYIAYVSSPEVAAVMLWWEHNELKNDYEGRLYYIDIENGIMDEIQIPEINFGYRADPEQGQYELKFE